MLLNRIAIVLILFVFSAQAAGGGNLLINPGFESGNTDGWDNMGSSIAASDSQAYSGTYSCLCSDRTEYWQGPKQNLLGKMINGQTYQCSAWVRIDNASSADVSMNIAQTDGAGTIYHVINRKTAYNNQWIQLTGQFTLNVTGTLTDLYFYFNWPDPGINFYVDDANVEGDTSDWKSEANARIDALRKKDAVIIVVDDNNQPVSGANVQINQVKKSFPFGCVMGHSLFKEPKFKMYYADIFKFNWAVFQNEAKWYSTEPSAWGYTTYRQMNAMLDFCESKGINARGHLIFWPVEQYIQQWVKDLNDSDLWLAMQQRLEGVVTQGLGRFKMWDVCSEMVTGTYFKNRLGDWVNTWMFQRTRELDPNVAILIDEYCVTDCGGAYLEQYKTIIRNLLNSGAPINVIGVECYQTNEFDPGTIMARLDSMAEFGLPVWVTQLRINEQNVNVRADKLETVFRTAYSHPAVKGIMQWTFYEENEGEPDCSLIDKGWHINAAGQRYLDLMNEWETHDANTTDANGTAKFRGFQGNYEITVNAGGNSEIHKIEVNDAPGYSQFTLKIGTGTQPDNTPPETNLLWILPPQAQSYDVVTMTAGQANDNSGILYYFNNVTDPNHDSGWQESNFYADSGLISNTNYTYRFKVRDKSTQQNETQFSNTVIVKTPGSGGSIIANAGFEAATAIGWGWNAAGGNLIAVTDHAHSGSYSGLTEIRSSTGQGPSQDITGKVNDGKTYRCFAWVRLENSTSGFVSMSIKQVDDGGTHYYGVASGTAYDNQWVCLDGTFPLNVNGTLQNLSIYISGPAAGVNFYVDDLVVKTDPVNCTDVQQFGLGLIADLDHDCYVDFNDLGIFALGWLETNCGIDENCRGSDSEPDGDVDLADLSVFCSMWLHCNDPQNPGQCN